MSTTTYVVSIQSTPTGAARTFAFAILIDGAALNETHNVLEINWDFGDGNSVEELEPTHTYSVSGSYEVRADVIFGESKGDGDQSSSSGGDPPPPTQCALTTVHA